MLLPLLMNLDQFSSSYVALYNTGSGYVVALWAYASTENSSTALADGYLELDGARVAEFDSVTTGFDLVLLGTAPTFKDTAASSQVYAVDNVISPTDIAERTDTGKDPEYPFS